MSSPPPPSFRTPRLLRSSVVLPLLLLMGSGACGPVYRASAQSVPAIAKSDPSQAPAAADAADPDARRLLGTWALSDCGNQLFNLLLRPDGSAMSILGNHAPSAALPAPLTPAALMQLGRWRAWGNGIRVDYGSGWTDTILIAPGGPIQWSWKPGADRGQPPSNTGKALSLTKPEMAWVGVYRFAPTQPQLPPYLATLLSSGQAFNSIDAISAGTWRQEPGRLVIDWASGWRTSVERASAPAPGETLRVLHWAPGRDRQGPPSAERSGERL